MSPYCSDCGAQVRQMDSYCWQCGSELEFGDTGSASTRQRDRPGQSDTPEDAGADDVGGAFTFGDTGEPGGDPSRDASTETGGYVEEDEVERGGDAERDIYGSGGEDRHSYGEEDESRRYAEEPGPRDQDGSTSGDDAGEDDGRRSVGTSETDSLDSEINRIDETPGSRQEVERSEPPWKETDTSDLEASGSVSEDRPRYVRRDTDGGSGKSAATASSGSTAALKLGVSMAVLGAVAAALAHDQVAGVTALAPVVEDALPAPLTEEATMVTVRTAGMALAALGAVVAVVGRYRT